MSAIFATHLHEMEGVLARTGSELPTLRRVTMDASVDADTGDVTMSYLVTDTTLSTYLPPYPRT